MHHFKQRKCCCVVDPYFTAVLLIFLRSTISAMRTVAAVEIGWRPTPDIDAASPCCFLYRSSESPMCVALCTQIARDRVVRSEVSSVLSGGPEVPNPARGLQRRMRAEWYCRLNQNH